MLSAGEVFCAHWLNNVGIFIIETFLGQILHKKKKKKRIENNFKISTTSKQMEHLTNGFKDSL